MRSPIDMKNPYGYAILFSIKQIRKNMYYQTIDKLEKMGVDKEYIQGWVGGYLGNPQREEQRLTEAYEMGYKDGTNKEISSAEQFCAVPDNDKG